MKRHILTALREELEQWERHLDGMTEQQITAHHPTRQQSIKDEIAHLHAWQQRTNARVEAARLDQEPVFPAWPAELIDESGGSPDPVNAWIQEVTRDLPWPVVYERWRSGFLHLLESAEAISERDLLDSSRFAWLHERPLALYLLASYDHHHEHLEGLFAWSQG